MTDKKTQVEEALRTERALKLALEALEANHSTVYGTSMTARAITAIREALAEQPAQQQEPVAYRHKWDKSGERCVKCGDKDWMGGTCTVPDTAPQASKPLTDEQIEFIRVDQEFTEWSISEAAFRYAARAIEAAHGIKEKNA